MNSTFATDSAAPSKSLNVSLWVVQVLLALGYVGIGLVKLATPPAELSRSMPWTGQHPMLLQVTRLVDIAGGLGLVFPALTRIMPGITILAALGCSVLQIFAIVFHVSRGEAALTPLNFILLALSLFIFWGRLSKAPIRPRA